jgi:hypothetical protein
VNENPYRVRQAIEEVLIVRDVAHPASLANKANPDDIMGIDVAIQPRVTPTK